MAEKFGLNWKQYGCIRMQYMLEVMNSFTMRDNRNNKKAKNG